jgi:UDP-3-O-[3-hydroxymyristoyl] glucosamine N-acyltransferase
MFSNRFFNIRSDVSLEELANITETEIGITSSKKKIVKNLSTLELATSDELSFIHSPLYLPHLSRTNAGFCIISKDFLSHLPENTVPLISKNPYFSYSKAVSYFYQPKEIIEKNKKSRIGKDCQISHTAYIGNDVTIGERTTIMPGAVILDNCEVGSDCYIGANSVISFARIGNQTEIFNGCQIGQEGFGFVNSSGINYKIPQIGAVIIGNQVTVGANTCVDRGTIGDTIIGNNVKIDNLVQIAHNVIIDQGSIITGCVAIAGSTKIGKFVQIGGNSSIAGHLKIGDFVKIAGMSGVMRDIESGGAVGGTPAVKIKDYHRITATLRKLIKKQS